MIFIDEKLYSEEFKERYYEVVLEKLSKLGFGTLEKKNIIKDLNSFFPPGFFNGVDDPFKYFVLMPYLKVLEVKKFIDNNSEVEMKYSCYKRRSKQKVLKKRLKMIYDAYGKMASSKVEISKNQNTTIRVHVAQQLKITICPYCNRDYINCRDVDFSGAQLDHFFPRDKYPFFSVCLYNLVPVCANCNRIKSAKNEPIISPFDVKSKISMKFKYEFIELDRVKIIIESGDEFRHNVKLFKLENAYEIHAVDVQELLYKQKVYNETQKEEIVEVLSGTGVDLKDIKDIIFGRKYSEADLRNKSLGKLKNDIRENLSID